MTMNLRMEVNSMDPDSVNYRCGILPGMAPLASPYVPFQQNNPEKYPADRGLIRGTLYPGLDLPFLGMVNDEEKSDTPMHRLQALAFALQELGLYLDTHREDREAAELFAQYAGLYRQQMEAYQAQYGPICQKDAVMNGTYLWTGGPWPWEIAANGEE